MIFEDWGLIDYQKALDQQLKYVDQISGNEDHPGFLIFCIHPAVVTTGRQTQASDVFAWQGPIIEISRGGRATYHGPSQLVVYPILNIKKPRKNRGPQEIRGYLSDFQSAINATLNEFGVLGISKNSDKGDDTGIWIETPEQQKKIVSVGIAVKKWVTYHGAAINVFNDPLAFAGLNPCGYKSDIMISMEKYLNQKVDLDHFKKQLKNNLDLAL